jgi:hypothetical protein
LYRTTIEQRAGRDTRTVSVAYEPAEIGDVTRTRLTRALAAVATTSATSTTASRQRLIKTRHRPARSDRCQIGRRRPPRRRLSAAGVVSWSVALCRRAESQEAPLGVEDGAAVILPRIPRAVKKRRALDVSRRQGALRRRRWDFPRAPNRWGSTHSIAGSSALRSRAHHVRGELGVCHGRAEVDLPSSRRSTGWAADRKPCVVSV